MPSPSAHRRSPIPEHRVSRQSSSSNGSEIIGSLSGYHRSGSPLLAQGYNDVPWETYEAEVEKVVNLIGNSDISDDWAGSVLRPFEAEWEHQDGRTRAILLERIRHTVACLEAVPGERRHREDYCFSGAIPPFEQLISGGLLRHAGSGTVDVPQKSFFRVATAQYVVAQALDMLDHPHSQASSNELNSPEVCEEPIHALAELYPPLESTLIELSKRVEDSWRFMNMKQRRLILNIFLVVHNMVQAVVSVGQIDRSLYYLWMPPLHKIYETVNSHGPKVFNSINQILSHSVSHSSKLLSDRKKSLYGFW